MLFWEGHGNITLQQSSLYFFCTTQGSILRGERYTLLRNNGPKWDVKDTTGRTMNVPGVCFIIPPTDPEAVSSADRWVLICCHFQPQQHCHLYKLVSFNMKIFCFPQSDKPAQRHQTESGRHQKCITETAGGAEEREYKRSRFVEILCLV